MKWEKRPLVSIITPLYHTPEKFLRELIESVMASSYDNWQLCLVDATSVEEERKRFIRLSVNISRKTTGMAENRKYYMKSCEKIMV